MIKPQWLELSLSRTNLHGPTGVRAIEVPLYSNVFDGHFHKQRRPSTFLTCTNVLKVQRTFILGILYGQVSAFQTSNIFYYVFKKTKNSTY